MTQDMKEQYSKNQKNAEMRCQKLGKNFKVLLDPKTNQEETQE